MFSWQYLQEFRISEGSSRAKGGARNSMTARKCRGSLAVLHHRWSGQLAACFMDCHFLTLLVPFPLPFPLALRAPCFSVSSVSSSSSSSSHGLRPLINTAYLFFKARPLAAVIVPSEYPGGYGCSRLPLHDVLRLPCSCWLPSGHVSHGGLAFAFGAARISSI